jgi:hypothetical protein
MAADVEVRRATNEELPWIWRLVHAEYLRRGLITPEMDGMFSHYQHLDCIPETVPLVAVDGDRLVGTMTTTFDGPRGLPTDIEYPDETGELRMWHSLASCWRLATDIECHSSHAVSAALMVATAKLLMEHGEPTVLMECHPRHSLYYRKRIGFEVYAERKMTPGLTNAPSVLMVGGVDSYSRLLKKG